MSVNDRLNGGEVVVTMKNVYNFSESLTHVTTNGKFSPMNRYWRGLTKEDKQIVLDRLNNKLAVLSWFNISQNIKNTFPGLSNQQVSTTNIEIHTVLRKHLSDIVFESMIMRGCLSQFIPNPQITNNENIPQDDPDRLKKVGERTTTYLNNDSELWNNSFYYLTNKKYSQLRKFKYNGEVVTYADYCNKRGWFDAYALNYISQISFSTNTLTTE